MIKIDWDYSYSDSVEHYELPEVYLKLDYKYKSYALKVYGRVPVAVELDLVHKLTDFFIKINNEQ